MLYILKKTKLFVMKILIFSYDLKVTNVTPVFKKEEIKQFYPIHLRYIKDNFTTKFGLNKMVPNLHFNVVLAKNLIQKLPRKHVRKIETKWVMMQCLAP